MCRPALERYAQGYIPDGGREAAYESWTTSDEEGKNAWGSLAVIANWIMKFLTRAF